MKTIVSFLLMSFFFLNCNTQEELSSISTNELKTLLQNDTIQLLDIRAPEEVKLGSIDKAKFANFFDDDFAEQVSTKFDIEKPIYIYCRSGNRSVKALKLLKPKGYVVINVLGGYNKWKAENK